MKEFQWTDELAEKWYKYHIQACWGKSIKEVIKEFKSKYTPKKWKVESFYKNRNNQDVINSIQRLSDGEVFTVGDQVISDQYYTYTVKGDITRISYEPISDTCIICTTYSGIGFCLSSFQKAPKPLFITEDGVEVFENDRPWCLNTTEFRSKGTADLKLNAKYHPAPNCKYFSTKEKMEEYKLNNKKQFSLNDVRAALDSDKSYQYHTTIENLKRQIKQ